jgi:hypothetical protein
VACLRRPRRYPVDREAYRRARLRKDRICLFPARSRLPQPAPAGARPWAHSPRYRTIPSARSHFFIAEVPVRPVSSPAPAHGEAPVVRPPPQYAIELVLHFAPRRLVSRFEDPAAFPVRMAGRRSQRPFRGLLGLHSHCGQSTRRPTHGGPMFRALQRFGCPPRRLGSYRDVPTIPRTGLSPARDMAPFASHIRNRVPTPPRALPAIRGLEAHGSSTIGTGRKPGPSRSGDVGRRHLRRQRVLIRGLWLTGQPLDPLIKSDPQTIPTDVEIAARTRGCYTAALPALAAVLRDDPVAAYERELPPVVQCVQGDSDACIAHSVSHCAIAASSARPTLSSDSFSRNVPHQGRSPRLRRAASAKVNVWCGHSRRRLLREIEPRAWSACRSDYMGAADSGPQTQEIAARP